MTSLPPPLAPGDSPAHHGAGALAKTLSPSLQRGVPHPGHCPSAD